MADGTKATSRLPLAVLVSGAPGSGKTTLAASLGVGLDLPVLHKDQLVHGIWRTRDRALDLGAAGVEPFYRTMELWAEHRRQLRRRADLLPAASASPTWRGGLLPGVSSSMSTAGAGTRWRASNAASATTRSVARRDSRKLLPLAERLQSDLYEPLMLDCPLIVVDTDDGYTPPLQNVTRPDRRDLQPPPDPRSRPARSEPAEPATGATTVQQPGGYPLAKRSCPA